MRRSVINNLLLLLLSISASYCLQAQIKNIPDVLKTKLADKTRLVEIMNEVEDYYENEGENEKHSGEFENEYVHWKRWEWWMSSHLNGNGNFVKNVSKLNNEALDGLKTKWGAVMETEKSLLENQQSLKNREQSTQNLKVESPTLAYGNWTSIGPTEDGSGSGEFKGLGRLDRIAFHPTNANIFYIGTPSGQLWKTTNGGNSWVSVTDALGNSGVSGIAVSPTNGNIVYFLSGDGDSRLPGFLVYNYGSTPACVGVYKTTDGGFTWTKTGDMYTGTDDFVGHRLAISSSNGNLLLAATNQGIYRTINGGSSWSLVKTGEHWDVKFKPGDDNTVYATSGNQIFYSTSGGITGSWNAAVTDFPTSGAERINLAVTNANNSYVYALCSNASIGSFTGLFRSVNSGTAYSRRCNTPNIFGSQEDGSGSADQSKYDMGITVKPTDANYLATCGLNVWVSDGSNGGSSMVWSTKYRESDPGPANKYIHPDVHDVQYNPLNNYLYAGTDGGIYRSTDDGTSWTNLSSGVATSQFYGMTMQDTDGNGEANGINLLAGAQDNGIKYRPTAGGSVFGHVMCCDGYGVGIAPNSSNTLYMNINNVFAKSTDGGATYSTILNGITFFSPIAMDYNNSNTVYLGGFVTRKSTDGFSTSTNYSFNTKRVLSTCPSNSSRLYGSAGTNLIRSDDGAVNWTTKSGTTGWPTDTLVINDIEAHPGNSLNVYVCFGGYSAGNKVLRSLNGGDSWTNWSGTLPDIPTYGLCVSTEGVYLGTELGVFFRGYSMTDWVPFYNGMPSVSVTELAVNENGFIYASTFGRGVWGGDRRSSCSSSIAISGVLNGNWYYEASNDATATLTSPGSIDNEIFMQAGNYVVLNPGFEVKGGAFFKGYIAPCSDGGLPSIVISEESENNIVVPHIREIKPKEKLPLEQTDYWQVADDKFEFYLKQKGVLKMILKQEDGSWVSFYPDDIFYPGFYSLPIPDSETTEFKFLLNGKEIVQLKI